jgi:hypothetical protein
VATGAKVTTTSEEAEQKRFQEGVVVPKGLKGGAVGLFSSIGVGIASTAPPTASRPRSGSWW